MNAPFAGDLPKGIQKITVLPGPILAELWDSIIVEAEMKEHLLSQAARCAGATKRTMSRMIWFNS